MAARAFWPGCNDWNSYLCLKRAQRQQKLADQESQEALERKIKDEKEAPFTYLKNIQPKSKSEGCMRISFVNVDKDGSVSFDASECFTIMFYMEPNNDGADPLKKFAPVAAKSSSSSSSTGNYMSLRSYNLFVLENVSVSGGVAINDVSLADFTPESVSLVEIYMNDDVMVSRKKFAPLEFVTTLLENDRNLVLSISVKRLLNAADRIASSSKMQHTLAPLGRNASNGGDIVRSSSSSSDLTHVLAIPPSQAGIRSRVHVNMGRFFFQLQDGLWSVHDTKTETLLIGPFESKTQLINKFV